MTSNDLASATSTLRELAINSAHAGVREMLNLRGSHVWPIDDIQNTPRRVVAAFLEMTNGYELDAADVLGTTFKVGSAEDQIVVLRGIEFVSLCAHHLLPFTGTASIAYLPKGGLVVGLSKLSRLVKDVYARRLQLQETLGYEVALAVEKHLGSSGVAVLIEAQHTCMSCRGVHERTARMVTSVMRGIFREDPTARAEVLGLLDKYERSC